MPDAMQSSRREFIASLSALGLLGTVGCSGSLVPDQILRNVTCWDAIRLMKEGRLSAVTLATQVLARVESRKDLNAFITVDKAQVLRDAAAADALRRSGAPLGPLHGLPIALKDVINTLKVPTSYATQALIGHRPHQDAEITRRLLGAGAILLGKTNCDELSCGSGSQDSAFGGVKNPYDLGRIPGGSSGGSAASVGAGVVPMAIGADTTGSIRMPAGLCGAVGFKPTVGRYSTAGVWPISSTMDEVGPICRHASDLMLFDRVLCDDASPFPFAHLHGMRIGVPRKHFYNRSNDTAMLDVIEKKIRLLSRAGAVIVETDFADISLLDPMAVAYPILFCELQRSMEAFIQSEGIGLTLRQIADQFTPNVKGIFEGLIFADPFPFDLAQALRDRQSLIQMWQAYVASNRLDMVAVPCTPFTATQIGQTSVRFDNRDAAPMDVIENSTAPIAAMGLPSVAIPAGYANGGMPVSMLFIGEAGQDRKLLSAATIMEPLFDVQLLLS